MGRGRTAVAMGAVLLALSCGTPGAGDEDGSGCPSTIVFSEHTSTEGAVPGFRPDRDRGRGLGDGTYPGCRDGKSCDDGPGGFSTDVSRLVRTDPELSVVGLRAGSHRYVVFDRTTAG